MKKETQIQDLIKYTKYLKSTKLQLKLRVDELEKEIEAWKLRVDELEMENEEERYGEDL